MEDNRQSQILAKWREVEAVVRKGGGIQVPKLEPHFYYSKGVEEILWLA